MSTDTLDDFRALEALYTEKPGAYRRKVMRLIATGYLYIVLAIGAIVALVIGGAIAFGTGSISFAFLDNYIRGALPLLIVAAIMARALFVRIPPPEGVVLDNQEKAQVIAFIDDIRKATGNLEIHDVVITNELNAAVQQLPTFGIIGPSKNYLILGLPLLDLCTPDEIKAIIAHEFGHLSHRHGRIGAMVYRLNTTLVRAAQEVEEKSKRGTHARSYRALLWFQKKFNKLTFAMRRGQEYEADRVAAHATSAEAIASSLCRLYALDRPLAAHWDGIWATPRHKASNTSVAPFAQLRTSVAGQYDADAGRGAVEAAMQIETGYSDSHPSLQDRLAALQAEPVTRFDFENSALDSVFDPNTRAEVTRKVEDRWQRESAENWRNACEHYASVESQIKDLQSRRDDLDAEGLFQLARLIEDLDGTAAAYDVFQQMADDQPDEAWVQFHWGRVNLHEHFHIAEPALIGAAERDLELVGKVAPMLRFGYEQLGEPERIERFEPLLERYDAICKAADEERQTIHSDDIYDPIDLSDDARESLRAFFARFEELRKVWLVKKRVTHFQGSPALLLGYDVNTWHNDVEVNEQSWGQRVTDTAVRAFPLLDQSFWLIVEKKSEWRAVLDGVEGSVIHTGTGKARKPLWQKLFLGFLVLGLVALITAALIA
ncbi:MAG: M48 family metallopeptidase [Pseudomonadota bacterium]